MLITLFKGICGGYRRTSKVGYIAFRCRGILHQRKTFPLKWFFGTKIWVVWLSMLQIFECLSLIKPTTRCSESLLTGRRFGDFILTQHFLFYVMCKNYFFSSWTKLDLFRSNPDWFNLIKKLASMTESVFGLT